MTGEKNKPRLLVTAGLATESLHPQKSPLQMQRA